MVGNIIVHLTNDEDLRQDLWVHYLSGHSIETFSSFLEKIKIEYSQEDAIRESIHYFLTNPPTDRFFSILNEFSEFERSLICCLMFGLTISQISAYQGISEVRIRQTLSVIRYNNLWREYGFKEKTN